MMKILQSDSTDVSTLLVLFYVKVCILELLIRKTEHGKKKTCKNQVPFLKFVKIGFFCFAVPICNSG